MNNQPKVNRRFVKKGNQVIVKTEVSDMDLNTKDLLNNIAQIKANLDKINQQLEQLEANKVQIEANKKATEEDLKELDKFSEWAKEIQESKLKALVDPKFEEKKKAVEEMQKNDGALTLEQKQVQKYQMLQRELGTDKEVAEDIAREIIHDKLFVNCMFENPFK